MRIRSIYKFLLLALLSSIAQGQQFACDIQTDTVLEIDALFDVFAVDFDNDQDTDLVVENRDSESGSNDIVFLANDGNGNFTEVAQLALVPELSFASRIVDMNGDSDLDVLVIYTDAFGDNDFFSVFINEGDFNFADPVDYMFELGTELAGEPAVGDIDGDGDNDVCVPTSDTLFNTTPQTIDLFINDGNGVFAAGETLLLPSRPRGVELVDLDDDQDLDIITVGLSSNNSRDLFILRNDGLGNFSLPPEEYPVNAWAGRIFICDIDNDSILDATFSFSTEFCVLFGVDDEVFEDPIDLSGEDDGFRDVVGVIDVDGDSDKDLITSRGFVNLTTLFLNEGGRSLDKEFTIGLGFSPNSVAIGDFDGDGMEDAAVTHSSGNLEIIYFNCGDFLFGDVDGNGSVDLLDIDPFINLLQNGEFQIEADINRDNVVNLLDVAGFVALLAGN